MRKIILIPAIFLILFIFLYPVYQEIKNYKKRNIEATKESLKKASKIIGEIVISEHKGQSPNRLDEIMTGNFKDIWRNGIEYKLLDKQKNTFSLRSAGPDGKLYTSDDLLEIGTINMSSLRVPSS